jgi:hypothetical protein
VPEITPVSTPVSEPISATDVELLVHTPPGTASVSVSVDNVHAVDPPLIADGVALTVIFLLIWQPVVVSV